MSTPDLTRLRRVAALIAAQKLPPPRKGKRQLLYCRRDAGLTATGFYSVFKPFHAEATVSKMYGTAMNACTQLLKTGDFFH